MIEMPLKIILESSGQQKKISQQQKIVNEETETGQSF